MEPIRYITPSVLSRIAFSVSSVYEFTVTQVTPASKDRWIAIVADQEAVPSMENVKCPIFGESKFSVGAMDSVNSPFAVILFVTLIIFITFKIVCSNMNVVFGTSKMLVGMGTKQITLTLPVMMLIYDYYFVSKGNILI